MEAFQFIWRLFVEHVYVATLVSAFIDATGTPFPGRVVLIAAGAAAAAGSASLTLLTGLAALGAVLGDHGWYLAGRLGQRRVLNLYCRLSLGSRQCVQRTERYFKRFGPGAIILGRFVAGVRLFAAPLAGSGTMSYPRFLFFEVLGGLLWAAVFVGLGYALGERGRALLSDWKGVTIVLTATLVATLLATLGTRLWRRRRHGRAILGA
jgi:membrane protein DedA with SNARE-associated domain